jgi:putative ABC transport system permease protein
MAPARDWLRDLGFGARRLRRTPGFATAVVLTLGLGIGANTAVFRVLYCVALRPLPFPEAERLVRVAPEHWFTAQQLAALLPQLTAFEALAPAARGTFTLGGEGPAEEVSLSLVDAGHFDVFRVAPLVGRALAARDSRPGAEPVVVLGYALWQRRFGGRADVVGTHVALSGEGAAQRRVVGVMPPGYQPLPWPSDALVPMLKDPKSPEWGEMARCWLLGRLREKGSLDSAGAELQTALARLSAGPNALFPRSTPREHGRVQGYLDSWVGPVADRLWLMLAALVPSLRAARVDPAAVLGGQDPVLGTSGRSW